jgi:hypothetical protein
METTKDERHGISPIERYLFMPFKRLRTVCMVVRRAGAFDIEYAQTPS